MMWASGYYVLADQGQTWLTPPILAQEKEQEKTDLGAFNAHTGKKSKLLTGAVERNAITEHGGNNPMETVYDLTTCARQMRNYRECIAPRQRTQGQGQRDNGPTWCRSKTRPPKAPDDAWDHPTDVMRRDERPSETAGGEPTDGT
jgi:hypothetical protein